VTIGRSHLIVCAVACATLAPSAAEACRSVVPGGCDSWQLASELRLPFIVGASLAIPSLVLPGAILWSANRPRGVHVAIAATSTVLWLAHTGLAGASTGAFAWYGSDPIATAIAGVYLSVSVASVGLSLWSLGREASAPRVTVVPAIRVGSVGATVGGSF